MSKILVVDDEESILRVLSISLKSDGHDVYTPSNGAQGLSVFNEENPDIVLTDIKMPGMGGIEVLGKIKAQNPDTEVIIITGHGDIDNAIEALKHGASDFLNKPIRDEALSIALSRAEEKREIRHKLAAYTENLERDVRIATQELRRNSNFLSKLILSSNEGIVATDQNFQVVVYNPGAERIFGYSASEVIPKFKASDLFPKALLIGMKEKGPHSELLENMPWSEGGVIGKSGDTIPVRYTGTYLYEDEQIMGSVAFFQDMREIKRLEDELVRSERLAAIGQTVAGLAHGVKNILQGLKGGSYLVDIGIDQGNSEKLKNGWDMIKRNIGRTSDLVMDLLTYSKEREPEYEPCFPNDIAEDVCDLMEEKARENHIELEMNFDAEIGEVLMDSNTLHCTLLNLMTNAIDACIFDKDNTKQFRVRIETGLEPEDRIRFMVSDNGMGMDDSVREKLFASFFSTKGHRGTGLGMLVVRKMIEEHDGTIDFHSEPGIGTEFSVRLPFRKISG